MRAEAPNSRVGTVSERTTFLLNAWEGVGCGGATAGLTGAPGPCRALGTGRHAQVRRATYTYGVVPQEVQLLHQLRDQDVLEEGDRLLGGSAGQVAAGLRGVRAGAGVTITPSASQYACRGLFPSTKWVWWKLMAGDFLSLS